MGYCLLYTLLFKRIEVNWVWCYLEKKHSFFLFFHQFIIFIQYICLKKFVCQSHFLPWPLNSNIFSLPNRIVFMKINLFKITFKQEGSMVGQLNYYSISSRRKKSLSPEQLWSFYIKHILVLLVLSRQTSYYVWLIYIWFTFCLF